MVLYWAHSRLNEQGFLIIHSFIHHVSGKETCTWFMRTTQGLLEEDTQQKTRVRGCISWLSLPVKGKDCWTLVSVSHVIKWRGRRVDITWKKQPPPRPTHCYLFSMRHPLFSFVIFHKESVYDVFRRVWKEMRGDMERVKPWIANKEKLPKLGYVCLQCRVAWEIQWGVRQLNST